jgi:hypothetical protein
MDRTPRPAPFPVGARVRYRGRHINWFEEKDGTRVWYMRPGLEHVIEKEKPGRRGTLRIVDEDELSGEPIRDTTTDGYSVYSIMVDGERVGRIIWPDAAGDWELIGPGHDCQETKRS